MELFIIKDYDDGKVLSYYFTDNASKCEEMMCEVDKAQEEDETEIARDKFELCWQSAFENECHRQGVMVEEIYNEYRRTYYY